MRLPFSAALTTEPPSRTARDAAPRPFALSDGPVPRATWWEICEADASTTFFATPDWADILTSSFRRFRERTFFFDLGADAACLIPAIEVRRAHPQLSAWHSMPFGTYGGVLCRGRPEAPARDAAVELFVRSRGPRLQRTLYPNPLADPLPERFTTRSGYVHALDLSRGWRAWWEDLDGGTRYEVHKAERRGVEVRSGMDAAAFETFCEHHFREASARESAVAFPARFYRAVWARRSPRIQLWTAHLNARMVAGVLVFRFHTHTTPFLSFVLPEARAHAPTHLIYAHVFRRAVEEGATEFNFLGSGGSESIEHFKASMGARRRDFRYVNVTGPVYRAVHHPAVPWVRRRAARLRRAGLGM